MAEQTPTYDELTIRIQPGDGDRYHTIASAPDGSTASGNFALPFTETEIDNFVLRVGRQRLPVRGYRSTQMEEAKEFGARLFDSLVVDEVRDVYRSARAVAEQSQKGLRVTLCLTDVPKLMDIPWEFLYERPRFLSQSMYSPIVRSLDLSEVRAPQPLTLPLNVLGMVSSPQGFGSLDVEREKEKLASALKPLSSQGLVTIEWLEHGTLRQLDEAINRRQGVHVFHYIGHGAYDPRTENGLLVLESERGEPHEVSGEELGLLLQDERSLRLAVLNSCEGARSSHLDPFSGVASSLVHHGVPAVIGMQFEITDEAAIAFAGRLYAALAQGFPVDAAVAQARRSIFAAGNDIEFGTPVLFLRGTEAHIFDVIDAPLPEAEATLPASSEPYLPPSDQEERFSAPASLEANADYQLEEQAYAPTQPLPNYLSWLPRPWQDWLSSGILPSLRKTLGQASNRRLVLIFSALLILGVMITTLFGHENAAGERQNTWGSFAAVIGFLGLIWVGVRFVHAKFRARYKRMRNWWTGNS